MPSLFVDKFEGRERGDEDEWEARIKIEIKTDNGERARFALVRVAWEGSDPGSETLEANKDGKIDERIGDFSTPTIQLTITDVTLDGYVYRPELNTEPTSIVVEGPDD